MKKLIPILIIGCIIFGIYYYLQNYSRLIETKTYNGDIYELYKGSPPKNFNGYNYRMTAIQESGVLMMFSIRMYAIFNTEQINNADYILIKTANAIIIIGGNTIDNIYCNVYLKKNTDSIW